MLSYMLQFVSILILGRCTDINHSHQKNIFVFSVDPSPPKDKREETKNDSYVYNIWFVTVLIRYT